jgi:hypothetical protein
MPRRGPSHTPHARLWEPGISRIDPLCLGWACGGRARSRGSRDLRGRGLARGPDGNRATLIAAYRDQARRSRLRGLVVVAGTKGPVGTDLGPWKFQDGVRAQRPGNARTREAALPWVEGCSSCEAQQTPRNISACEPDWEAGPEGRSEPAALSRGASVPDLSERGKQARSRDRRPLPSRNAGCVRGPLRPRPPQREVGTAGGSSRGLLSPAVTGDAGSGSTGAGSYPRVCKEGCK